MTFVSMACGPWVGRLIDKHGERRMLSIINSAYVVELGGYALTAITAVTAQNTQGLTAWRAVSPALLGAQLKAALADFPGRQNSC